MDQDVSQLLEKQNLESNRFHTVNPCVVPVLMKVWKPPPSPLPPAW